MKSKYIFLLFALYIICVSTNGQSKTTTDDPAEHVHEDTSQVKTFLLKANSYYFTKPDSCLEFAKKALALSRELHFQNGELQALNIAGEALRFLGEFPQALETQFQALQINNSTNDKEGEAMTLGFIGFTYVELNEFRQGLNYLLQARAIYEHISNPVLSTFNASNIGNAYEGLGMIDSAFFFQNEARAKSGSLQHNNLKILISTRLGIAFARSGKYQEAFQYYHNALESAYLVKDKVNPGKIQYRMSALFLLLNQQDSALYYARLAFFNSEFVYQKLQILQSSELLVQLFRNQHINDSVIYYQDIAIAMNDSLFGPEKLRQLQLFTLNQQEEQHKILEGRERDKNNAERLTLLIIIILFVIIAIILYTTNRHKQKVNILLGSQKNEIQQTLTELKSTQAQLIQSEKMASLGELTAGIAHEIQNPLNFVNNFSDVNKELVDELQTELKAGNTEEALAISNDIKDNEEKINHHGKRADSIVKGMLQHSKKTSGQKEPTDINALADEYLRLAFHGMRAKDKSFNATLNTDFDKSIGNINIIPQDIGRVLLNLYNNAFYAVNERLRQAQPDSLYQPTVSVSIKRSAPSPLQRGWGEATITVSDNGNGIPQNIVDKIFQPFFTTKPTGQGTGLGLSLSYDIIKAHGGEIRVESKEGEGTEFIILLPIN